jgi:hypothetical protein
LEDVMSLNVDALNSLRGAAASALMKLLLARPELSESCLPTAERLAADPDPAVRIAAQGLCLPLLALDRQRAVGLFVRCCDHPDDRVLAGMYMHELLWRTWRDFPQELVPVLARMIGSACDEAAEEGAFWVTVGHVAGGLYSDLAAASLLAGKTQRKGAAHALARLCREADHRPAALPGVIDLFEDKEPEVVAQVVMVVRDKAVLESPDGPALAEAFVRSAAFSSYPGDLFFGLTDFPGSLVPFATAIQLASARLEKLSANPDSTVGMRAWGSASLMLAPLFRLYDEAEGAALDTLDSYLRSGMDRGRNVLAKLDL